MVLTVPAGAGRQARWTSSHAHGETEAYRAGRRSHGGEGVVTVLKGIAVLVSGGGTNLQALLDSEARGREPPTARSSWSWPPSPDAYALERAENAGVESCVVPPQGLRHREEFDSAPAGDVDRPTMASTWWCWPDSCPCWGPAFIARPIRDRILNVHPALIPSFCGHGLLWPARPRGGAGPRRAR